MEQEVMKILNLIRKKSPLVHNITNFVVMNNTANALLAVGASPVMAHAKEEIKDILRISSSLVINMGTLHDDWVNSMILAIQEAVTLDKPYVFDPVGAGASQYRIETANTIIKAGIPSVIRGNASEIMTLAKINVTTKGVDSTMAAHAAIEAAKALSIRLNNTVIVSGETDYIITGQKQSEIRNGNSLMTRVTGMGCMATAIVGACIGVEKDIHNASIAAMAIMGIAGDMAAEKTNAPGSFQVYFLDALYTVSEKEMLDRLKLKHIGH